MENYKIEKTSIIGHSFGGIVATLYASARSEKVERLILVDALFSQQETYDHILRSITKLARAKEDTASLRSISLISSLDRRSADYHKLCYDLASTYGYFNMPYPTSESKQLEMHYQNSEYGRTNIRNDKAPLLFYKNERQVNIDIKKKIDWHSKNEGKTIRHLWKAGPDFFQEAIGRHSTAYWGQTL